MSNKSLFGRNNAVGRKNLKPGFSDFSRKWPTWLRIWGITGAIMVLWAPVFACDIIFDRSTQLTCLESDSRWSRKRRRALSS